jgi:hypothetical protein
MLHDLSQNMREEHQMIQQMEKHHFWRVTKLPPSVQPHQVYPTKAELIKNTAFGKPHPCHSYTVTLQQ